MQDVHFHFVIIASRTLNFILMWHFTRYFLPIQLLHNIAHLQGCTGSKGHKWNDHGDHTWGFFTAVPELSS